MKKYTILLYLLLAHLAVFAQRSAYYDALYLSKMASASGGKFKISIGTAPILSYYFGSGLNDADLNTAILNSKDSFLLPYYSAPGQAGAANNVTSLNSSTPNVLGAVGGLDVTNIADGFAKFIVARTKQELSVAFFAKFQTLINEDDYKDAQILFPQTFAILNAIGSQIYNYEAYMNALRESFEKDLNGLLITMPNVINDPRYNGPGKFFDKHKDLKAICLSSLYVGNALMNKEHPGGILANFDVTILNDVIPIDVKASVQTLQLFSGSLRSNGTDHYWISQDSLGILLKDPVALQLYFGLVYQQAAGIKFSSDSLRKILSDNLLPVAKLNNCNSYIKGFVSQAAIVDQNISNISGTDKANLTFTDYYNLYNSSLDLLQYAEKINTIPGLSALTPGPQYQKDIIFARSAGNIALDINRKNYSSAIINTVQLYNAAFPGDTTNSKFKNFLLKYGSFAAAISQAQSSDDVQSAIEATVLPSGSSSIKRETRFNVSLNAYAGLFTGYEQISGVDKFKDFTLNSYGVTAPIGVAISTGKNHWSYSAFISVIDLGAITTFRFGNDSVKQVPNIQLKDIISPGLFFSLGLPKCPLSVNIGAQMGPNLRDVGANANEYANNLYWRYSISLLVDLPLLNLYTSQ